MAISQPYALGCGLLRLLQHDELIRLLLPLLFDDQLDLVDELFKVFNLREDCVGWWLWTCTILAEEELSEHHLFP